jgi:hypothetical protein
MPHTVGVLSPSPDADYDPDLPPEFLAAQSIVMEMTSRNVQPRRFWLDDTVEIDLSLGLVNFRSGLGATPESGFQGSAPRLPPEQERELKARIYRCEPVHIRELLPPDFEMVYRWKNHTLDDEDVFEFRWVGRDWAEVGRTCYESGDYRVYSGAERNWSGMRPMQVIMCVTGVKLTNTRDRISLSQAAFVQPLRAALLPMRSIDLTPALVPMRSIERP